MSEQVESTTANWFSARRLSMRGLKPSDYFLYKQEKEYFNFDMRQLVVLGLRVIYATAHGQITKEQLFEMATQIYAENLDQEDKITRPSYKEFSKIGE